MAVPVAAVADAVADAVAVVGVRPVADLDCQT